MTDTITRPIRAIELLDWQEHEVKRARKWAAATMPNASQTRLTDYTAGFEAGWRMAIRILIENRAIAVADNKGE